MLSISVSELIAVIGIAISAVVWFLIRDAKWRWAALATVCFGLASMLTPADLLSTVAVSFVLLAMFFAGWRSAVHARA